MHPGFKSACLFDIERVKANLLKNSTYPCIKGSDFLMYYMQNQDGKTFDAKHFLSLLRNKRLAVIGDSLALQNFQALEQELLCEETSRRNGNGTVDHVTLLTPEGKPWKSRSYFPHIIAGVRYYGTYDTTISWCVDQRLSSTTSKVFFDFCGKNAIMSDVILIGIGAHYKPLYINHTETDYYGSMYRSSDYLVNCIYPFRELVKKLNPNAIVMWRDYSHVGNHDELMHNATEMGVPMDPKRRNNGALWKHSGEEATWVSFYNKQFRKIADLYGDVYVEFNNVSHVVLDFFLDKHTVHADALHYCSAGLPRMANILIEDALDSRINVGIS